MGGERDGADGGAGGDHPDHGSRHSRGDNDGHDGTDCPQCGGRLPEGAAFCPHCRTTLDDSAVDLAELDGLLDGQKEGIADLVSVGADGRRRASRPIRLLAGLAVSVPLAPLVLFLVAVTVDLSAWTALTVFLVGWLVPAVYLVRAPLPAVAFGRSLYLVAVGTALVPVALRFGSASDVADLSPGLGAIAVVCFVVAAACLVLGTFVTTQARRGVDGEAQFLEGRGGE